jgi:hypothetical protein
MGVTFLGGKILTRKTEHFGEEPFPVPLRPPQIPHGLTLARTRAFAVRDRRLTTGEVAVGMTCSSDEGKRKHLQNFGGETSLNAVT